MKLIIFAFLASTVLCAQAQTGTGGGGTVEPEPLVPISMDEPYELDQIFLSTLWGDLYGRTFLAGESAIWLGEHLNENTSEPRRAILAERSPSTGHVTVPLSTEHIVFEEIARYPVEWIDPHNEQFWATLTDPVTGEPLPPAQLDTVEYEEAVVVRFFLQDGTTRLVVGFSNVIQVDILSPANQQATVLFENFWPLKRFFSEGQAMNYALDYAAFDDTADVPDLGITVGGGNPCSDYSGITAELCYCLLDLASDFNNALNACNFPEGGFTSGLAGAGAGGTVGVIGGGALSHLCKRVSGFWGPLIGGTVGGVLGFGAGYEWEVHACKVRAKAEFDANKAKAINSARKAHQTGSDFACPSDPH